MNEKKTRQTNLLRKMLPDVTAAKSVTLKVLREVPLSRGNDELLIEEVKLYCIENGLKVPASETITRCRRSIQNKDGLFLPDKASWERRQQRQEFFRKSAQEGLI